MGLKMKVSGREALTRRLNRIAPKVEEYSAAAKLTAATELAEAIRDVAPRGKTLEYAESIEADLLKSRPHQKRVGVQESKDPSATGIFAENIWRFLEFGTRAHASELPRRDRRYKTRNVLTKGKRAHHATKAQPHIFPIYRAMKPRIRKLILAAVNRGVREAMKK